MSAVKILPNIYWVGAIDWNIRHFHGYTYETKRGTTYNAYLILDDKITLADTVFAPFTEEMLGNIREVVPPEKIDYIVVNHAEADHSGALAKLLELCPKAKLFCSIRCKEALYRHYYADWNLQVVKTDDTLKLGKRSLKFIEAPMLHWPDSMFSYLVEEGLLLPNDAFGQHYATVERFDDEADGSVLMDEAAKYYANILWPLSPVVLKKLQEIEGLDPPIRMIAPSHGIIWRRDPRKIMDAYLSWAENKSEPKVVIAYETMWGATEKMAKAIREGIADAKIPVRLFDINRTERTEIIKEMLDSKGYIIGSSTHDNGMLPNMAGFMEFFKGLRPKNRVGAAFGSFGWGGGAVDSIEKAFKEAGVEIIQPPLAVKYNPDKDEIKACYEYGRKFAEKGVLPDV